MRHITSGSLEVEEHAFSAQVMRSTLTQKHGTSKAVMKEGTAVNLFLPPKSKLYRQKLLTIVIIYKKLV
jgi:hypothetical protein